MHERDARERQTVTDRGYGRGRPHIETRTRLDGCSFGVVTCGREFDYATRGEGGGGATPHVSETQRRLDDLAAAIGRASDAKDDAALARSLQQEEWASLMGSRDTRGEGSLHVLGSGPQEPQSDESLSEIEKRRTLSSALIVLATTKKKKMI